jgi:hypothetical protein
MSSTIGERILRELELVEAVSVADSPCYRVWRFHDAPEEMRALSYHGGDEDWIAHCPPGSEEPYWASEGSQFGCCSVSRHDLIDGSFVLIGAHS